MLAAHPFAKTTMVKLKSKPKNKITNVLLLCMTCPIAHITATVQWTHTHTHTGQTRPRIPPGATHLRIVPNPLRAPVFKIPTIASPIKTSANEETVNLLMEMGFSREHAVESINMPMSNRLEIAMEYALAHPPPSPTAIEIRRAAREARR